MRNDGADQHEMLFTTKQMTELLNLTARRIQQLAEEGVLVREQRGKYRAIESLKRYIRYIQEREPTEENEVDYYREKALHEKAKREKTELQVAVMKGELHRSEDVAAVMDDMVTSFRARCLALPTKIAPQLLDKKAIAEVQAILTSEIHEALTELSTYDPATFHVRNEEYVEVNEDAEDRE
ncbi:hypothetical protein [Brevibacillus parabrevis]|uniref:Uncharacterized protein n=1 Tax=Brevibacillus parabrevis TaxID=54914 RepID=A0A4Y3PQU0_BREPA|nr:hypothetical protein [Brevibacillus parabrevis]RNB94424.1 hypothetical protein EDM60_18725 [Brevibacillus parabrevis]GEB35295.1 hypothetical protein BPA01_48750 [Brevibacillus parabrevis]